MLINDEKERSGDNHSSIFSADKRKNWFVAILISCWVISTIFAFWWFQFRNIQAFDIDAQKNQTVFFESGELGERLESLVETKHSKTLKDKPISVVHFWNPDCLCNRFNEEHVKQIISEYSDKDVEFTIVVSGETKEIRNKRGQLAHQIFRHAAVKEIRSDWPMHSGPVSSPAAGIINRDGELVYFGPYSLGARCAPDEGKFVEKVLNRLNSEKQSHKKQLNTLAVGCFCPWRSMS